MLVMFLVLIVAAWLFLVSDSAASIASGFSHHLTRETTGKSLMLAAMGMLLLILGNNNLYRH